MSRPIQDLNDGKPWSEMDLFDPANHTKADASIQSVMTAPVREMKSRGIVNVSSMSRTAQMEINVCSEMAQTCGVAIPRLYSNGHRRERPTTY
jgi:hypothetical protein